MAKIYGLNGVLRGRQGNNVFAVQNGTQVVRAYQPVVFNPRSEGQRLQRTKFAFAGKLSGITPSAALLGMSGTSARSRRARFVQLITRSTVVTTTDGVMRASIPLSQIVFSEGSVPMYSNFTNVTAGWGSGSVGRYTVEVTVALSLMQAIAPDTYRENVIVALFDAETLSLDEIQVKTRSRRDGANISFSFRQGAQRPVVIAAYIAPHILRSSTSGVINSMVGGTTEEAFMNDSLTSGSAAADWGMSILGGGIALAAPSQAIVGRDDEEGSDGNERSVKKK